MGRSRVTSFLLTVFALAILALSASTLHTAHPDAVHDGGSTEPLGRSDSESAATTDFRPSEPSVRPFAFPQVDVSQGLDADHTRPSGRIRRIAVGIVLVLGGGFLVGWYLSGRRSHSDTGAETVEITSGHEVSTTFVEAGTAPPPTNEVYRAWLAMADSIAPSNESHRSPTELAEQGVREGFPEQPVRELTGLFCAVRYGPAQPTRDREQRAQRVLDRVLRRDSSRFEPEEQDPDR